MTGNRNLSVGIFVTAALLIGTVLVVWITGTRGTEPTRTYAILIENDVSGLGLGGPVYFLGVKVGEVTALKIVPGNPNRVRVDVEVLSTAPVDAGTWATLAPQGITGVSVINLYSDAGEHGPVREFDEFEHPVIPFRDSGFSALMSSAPAVLDKIETLLENANALLAEGNRLAVEQTLGNLASLSETLTQQQDALAALPATLDRTLAEFRDVAGEVRGLVEEAGPRAVGTLDQLEQASTRMADMTARLDDWLLTNDDEIRTFLGEGMGQIPALVGDTRRAVQELDRALEELRRNPSRVLYRPDSSAIEVER